MKKKIINIIEILLVIILLTSLYRIYNYNKEDKTFKSATREIQEKFEKEEVKVAPKEEVKTAPKEEVRAKPKKVAKVDSKVYEKEKIGQGSTKKLEGQNLLDYIKERNIVSGEMPDKTSDMITLQTCSPGDTRLVVQGVLVED